MMTLNLEKYKICTLDDHNFSLYFTRPKKASIKNPNPTGDTEELLGYYGSLSGALNKIVNHGFLNAPETVDAKKLLKAIKGLEKELVDSFQSVKPKQCVKK